MVCPLASNADPSQSQAEPVPMVGELTPNYKGQPRRPPNARLRRTPRAHAFAAPGSIPARGPERHVCHGGPSLGFAPCRHLCLLLHSVTRARPNGTPVPGMPGRNGHAPVGLSPRENPEHEGSALTRPAAATTGNGGLENHFLRLCPERLAGARMDAVRVVF